MSSLKRSKVVHSRGRFRVKGIEGTNYDLFVYKASRDDATCIMRNVWWCLRLSWIYLSQVCWSTMHWKDTLCWAGAGPPQLRSFYHILAAMRGHDWSYRITRLRRWSSETLSDVSGEEANHFMQLAVSPTYSLLLHIFEIYIAYSRPGDMVDYEKRSLLWEAYDRRPMGAQCPNSE